MRQRYSWDGTIGYQYINLREFRKQISFSEKFPLFYPKIQSYSIKNNFKKG